MAKIWMQGKERFMCPVCKNEEIELGQKYCQICGEALKWGGGQARMERLTIPDKKIPGGTRRALIDVRAVREEAVTIYWALKKYEDTGLTPEEIERLKEQHRWIPVEERLPEKEGEYLVTFSIGEIVRLIGYGCCQRDILGNNIGFGWYDLYSGTYLSDKAFIAWMPLPEPYRKEKNSNE